MFTLFCLFLYLLPHNISNLPLVYNQNRALVVVNPVIKSMVKSINRNLLGFQTFGLALFAFVLSFLGDLLS